MRSFTLRFHDFVGEKKSHPFVIFFISLVRFFFLTIWYFIDPHCRRCGFKCTSARRLCTEKSTKTRNPQDNSICSCSEGVQRGHECQGTRDACLVRFYGLNGTEVRDLKGLFHFGFFF